MRASAEPSSHVAAGTGAGGRCRHQEQPNAFYRQRIAGAVVQLPGQQGVAMRVGVVVRDPGTPLRHIDLARRLLTLIERRHR